MFQLRARISLFVLVLRTGWNYLRRSCTFVHSLSYSLTRRSKLVGILFSIAVYAYSSSLLCSSLDASHYAYLFYSNWRGQNQRLYSFWCRYFASEGQIFFCSIGLCWCRSIFLFLLLLFFCCCYCWWIASIMTFVNKKKFSYMIWLCACRCVANFIFAHLQVIAHIINNDLHCQWRDKKKLVLLFFT